MNRRRRRIAKKIRKLGGVRRKRFFVERFVPFTYTIEELAYMERLLKG